MILTPENVLTVEPNTIVMVPDQFGEGFTECRVHAGYFEPGTLFLTTTASNVQEYNAICREATGDHYSEFIKHFRAPTHEAIMPRTKMAELLATRNYTIS